MTNRDLARALEELAAMLEVRGENKFKVAAHAKGARVIAEFPEDLAEFVKNNELTSIPGIGKGLEVKIREFLTTGRSAELEDLRAEVPAGVLALMKVPGLGIKKARQIHDELGVTNVDELRIAIDSGRVAALKGYGEKAAAKILESIEKQSKFAGQVRLDVGILSAATLVTALERVSGVEKIVVAGEIRRRREVISAIDLVIECSDKPAFVAALEKLPFAEGLSSNGDEFSFQFNDKIAVRIVVSEPADFPINLLRATGSVEHLRELDEFAEARGVGLTGKFKSEHDIYRKLGLSEIVPELRAGMGEIPAAAKNALPILIERADLRGLMHMHTEYSDGDPVLEDYAKYAKANGYEWMAIADHSTSLKIANGLSEERVLKQHAEIDDVNAKYAQHGVRLLKGIECDILGDGSLDYTDEFRTNFEWIVASVHSKFNLPEKEQTRRICHALENPSVTVLGHLTGRLLLSRNGYACDQHEIIRAAAQTGVAIEINANPRRLELDWRLVREALDLGVFICISPDAHSIGELEYVDFGLWAARKGWCTKEQILNCLSAKDFLKFAASRK
ncbi:helix-hairpin-helix domain-containing protein [soil metagenome]